ncbi:helix-turn-helix domain-containing protein [Sphingomonas psychrolutea]|uniref:helix-turn-helix domain-containing protein n=1 Tax=Sphingomonas psychrolutea TaxID=1259676 RepID=UPI002549138E|nr:helix-turn-helix domain-containing protein [Sphingomonas psychrolutea]
MPNHSRKERLLLHPGRPYYLTCARRAGGQVAGTDRRATSRRLATFSGSDSPRRRSGDEGDHPARPGADRFEPKLQGKRSSSSLPGVIELFIARPIVSSSMITKELKVSHRAALNLVAELGVREVTGRGSFRAWGLI